MTWEWKHPKIWEDAPYVIIIGGGPSVLLFTDVIDRAHAHLTLACNWSFELKPEARVFYWADSSFFDPARQLIEKNFKGEYQVTRGTNRPHIRHCGFQMPLRWIQELTDHPLVLTPPGYVGGKNSGHQALNLAINLGARRIYLIGFDGGPVGVRPNYHSYYEKRFTQHSHYDVWRRDFESLAERVSLRLPDVKIFNTNKDSHLRCFPYGVPPV